MSKHLINIHSKELVGGGGKLPEPQQIEYGEIAVNYADSGETISIKNENDEIIDFKPHKFYGPVLSGLSKDITEINDFLFPENELNKAGTLIYTKNDGKYYAIAPEDWNEELGTAVGVMVIPQGFLPDGLARVMALNGVDSAGTITDIYNRMGWVSADTPAMDVDELHNLDEGPVVNPNTNEIINIRNRIYLPSDKFTTIENPIDPGTCWGQHSFIGPSPYGSDGLLNPIYCATAYTGGSINNALADFNGLENTRILCQSAETYVAANAAHSYKAYDGDSLEWYLPSMGELGFIMPRITVIIKALNSINKALSNVYCLWSSTEINDRDACTLIPSEGSAVSDEFGKNQKASVK